MPLPHSLREASTLVDMGLRASLERRGELLYRMLEYHLGWRNPQGEALTQPSLYPYGALCVLAGKGVGLSPNVLASLGAAIELLAHFHQVHREIQDGTPGPQERPALWWLWGPAQAINAGDGFHAMARLALTDLGGQGCDALLALEALRLLDKTALEMCEGRFQDLQLQERLEVTVVQCQRIAQAQTGALVGCALTLPALLKGLPPDARALCEQAGRLLGTGIHYWHDLHRWRTVSPAGVSGAMLNKSKTLPLALALQRGGPKEKRELGAFYVKRVLEPSDLPVLASVLERLGAFQEAEGMACQALDEGLALWRQVAGEEAEASLRPVVDYLARELPVS